MIEKKNHEKDDIKLFYLFFCLLMNNKTQYKIAITGPGNTWKTTIMNQLAEKIESMNRTNNDELAKTFTVSRYQETARQILNEKWFSTMQEFQDDISRLENERLELIKQDTADVLLFDRTAMDGLVYSIFNLEKWIPLQLHQTSPWEYDLVILFTEAFKQTNTEQFQHYNDQKLVELFRSLIKHIYWDKVVEFKNASELNKIKALIYEKIWVYNKYN